MYLTLCIIPYFMISFQKYAQKNTAIRNREFSDLTGKRESVYVSAVLYVRYVSYVLYVLSVLRVLCIFYTRSTMAPSPEKPEPDHDHPLPGHRPPH